MESELKDYVDVSMGAICSNCGKPLTVDAWTGQQNADEHSYELCINPCTDCKPSKDSYRCQQHEGLIQVLREENQKLTENTRATPAPDREMLIEAVSGYVHKFFNYDHSEYERIGGFIDEFLKVEAGEVKG